MRDCLHCGLPVPSGRAGEFCCFGCRTLHGVLRPATAEGEQGAIPLLRVQIFGGLFVALNVMALSLAYYGPGVFGDAAIPRGQWGEVAELFEYLILFLTTIVVAALGLPMFADALAEGRGRLGWLNARTLVCVGVFAAFALSAWHTLRGWGQIYFDTVTMVLVVITIGKQLEARARRGAARELAGALDRIPERVTIRRGGMRVEVASDELRVGDLVCVKPGQAAAADGTIEEGSSFIDSSSITGEPHARSHIAGDRVHAGSIAIDGMLWLRAERVDRDRMLARIEEMLREALSRRFPAVLFADRTARIMAPAVVLLALVAFAVGVRAGSPSEGTLRALSVLLIACPCALAVGPGLIMASAMRRAASAGIVFTTPALVERLAAVRRIFLDKTGTLTAASSHVESLDVADAARRDECLQLLASIEAQGSHPAADGMLRYARARGVEPRAIDAFHVLPGLGVQATVDGRRYQVGGRRLLESLGIPVPAGGEDEARTFLITEGRILAGARLSDPPRADAFETIEALAGLGVELSALSGDSPVRCEALGRRLGIAIEGGLLPEDKLRRIGEAVDAPGSSGVAMVGDGINDAAALARADVGIAVATATDLSRQAGNLLLMRDRLTLVPQAIAVARDARRRLSRSLSWAIVYNGVGVGLALTGRLHPVFAATSMVVSSLLVIAYSRNAGRVPAELTTSAVGAMAVEAST